MTDTPSDTPETDAQDARPIHVVINRPDGTTTHYVPANFSRRLERERDEAREVAETLVEYAHECLVQLESWGKGYAKYEQKMETIREAIAGCEKWKEAAK